MKKHGFVFLILFLFDFNSLVGLNLQLLDSINKYCSENRSVIKAKNHSFDKANLFINQLIQDALKEKNDSVLAQVYYFKALNYYYEANNYHIDEFGYFSDDWGNNCKNCKGELFANVSSYLDSVTKYLPYSYSKYKELYEKSGAIYNWMDVDIRDMKPEEIEKNLENTENRNTFLFYVIISMVLVVCLIAWLLILNYKRSKKIKFLLHNIEEKHKEITDSINYAERIQRSFLATKELLDENLKDYFVYFQPKDVVSGDFYWASKLNNNSFLLATADSTGHGVPGAIMSILNISSIEKAVENGCIEPCEILNHTRKTIIERLKRDGSEYGGKDGMDCCLIRFDFENNVLLYSAANNPIWIIRENELIELSGDKMPVGKHDKDTVSFTQHIIPIQNGDVIYTFTDGLPDQFGGPKGKKFMYKQLKQILLEVNELSMLEQKEKLKVALNNWKGELEQVDDICVVGVRI